ncbi:MAG: hypothetical protein KDA57_21075, partial [Planctomycetales bacterium]|nr:hypothetical protein [Planctomycetales bacterium]
MILSSKTWPALAVLLVVLAASVAWAGEDEITLYFDFEYSCDECTTGPALNVPFYVYVAISNPSAAEIVGAEFGYTVSVSPGGSASLARLENSVAAGAVDLGDSSDLLVGDYRLTFSEPLVSQPQVVVTTWRMVRTAGAEVEFFLGPANVQSIDDGQAAYIAPSGAIPLAWAC